MTLVELLVATTISLSIVAMTIGMTISTRGMYHADQTRMELNQNIRGALDVMGIEIREGGERLPSTFPAIEINDGAAGAPDELVIRRNLLDEVLVVCTTIASGSSNAYIYLSDSASGIAACAYGAQSANMASWQNYRTTNGSPLKAYIFDQTTKLGEFFEYDSETDNGTNLVIHRSDGGTFEHTYSGGLAAIYVIEEWTFKLNAEEQLLQLVRDEDDTNPLNVAYTITDFQAKAYMQDGTVQDSFAKTDDWSELASIEISINGSLAIKGKAGTVAGDTIERSLSARFFPRNILSN